MFYLVKNIVTTLYAVLIRQIVICPCLYGPLIAAACEGDAPQAGTASANLVPQYIRLMIGS